MLKFILALMISFSAHADYYEFIVPEDYSYGFENALYPQLKKVGLLTPLNKTIAREQIMMWAINNNELEIVKDSIKEKADVMHRGGMPIEAAAAHGHNDIIQALLDAGADLKEGNHEALRTAAKFGHIHTVKFLQTKGEKLSQKNLYLMSSAARNGQLAMVDYLLSQNVEKECSQCSWSLSEKKYALTYNGLNQKQLLTKADKEAILFDALYEENWTMIDSLTKEGIRLGAVDTQTLVKDLAGRRPSLKAVAYLIDHGAKLNRAIMLEAVKYGAADVEALLLSKGLNKIEGKERYLIRISGIRSRYFGIWLHLA